MLKFLFTCLALICASPASADLFIPIDHGGRIADYVASVAASARPIKIDGYCMSACTVKLAKGCVTRRAVLMFHGAYDPHILNRSGPWDGLSEVGNDMMMRHYPPRVAAHVRRNGWLLSSGFSEMTGAEAIKLGVPECKK